ncbi:hypothetical protein QO004_004836 [Rhizobium mesoamericanum]|nr:hypothetical protein [Rhizobium mesoamericanum]
MTGLDDEAVAAILLRRDNRRLDDPDRLDGGEQQRIGLRRRFRSAGAVGIVLQRAGIEFQDMHGKLLLPGFGAAIATPSCLQFFPKTLSGPQGGQAGATAVERPCREAQAGLFSPARGEWPGCAAPG